MRTDVLFKKYRFMRFHGFHSSGLRLCFCATEKQSSALTWFYFQPIRSKIKTKRDFALRAPVFPRLGTVACFPALNSDWLTTFVVVIGGFGFTTVTRNLLQCGLPFCPYKAHIKPIYDPAHVTYVTER